jgi:hypothetical protein
VSVVLLTIPSSEVQDGIENLTISCVSLIALDSGSQGTRLHIYEWDKRFLLDEDDLLQVTQGKALSIPTSNSRWTDKYLRECIIAVYLS